MEISHRSHENPLSSTVALHGTGKWQTLCSHFLQKQNAQEIVDEGRNTTPL